MLNEMPIMMVAGGEIESLLRNCEKSLIKIEVEGFESHVLARPIAGNQGSSS